MSTRLRRIAFVIFAAALFIGTHIPNLRVKVGNVDRPDLLIHLCAFGGWFVLLLATGWLGPWRSPRSIAVCAIIAGVYAVFDEFTQAIPGLHRTAALDDLAANVCGIAIAAIGALIVSRLTSRRQSSAPDDLPAQTPSP